MTIQEQGLFPANNASPRNPSLPNKPVSPHELASNAGRGSSNSAAETAHQHQNANQRALMKLMQALHLNVRRLKSRVFMTHGRRPFARGYGAYRDLTLRGYLQKGVPEGVLPDGWGMWLDERAVEYPWLLSRLPFGPGRLLDAGSALNYEYVLSHEKLQNKSVSIFTLAPESESFWNRGISYVYGDLRDCCYRDEYFDWIASISTLEHVGMNNTQLYTNDPSNNEFQPESYLQAVTELRRVLKSGGMLYVTLPFGRVESLGWLQIFDTARIDRLLNTFRPASYHCEYFRYTEAGWQIASPDECRDARYFNYWQDRGKRTDLAAAEAVVCLELIK